MVAQSDQALEEWRPIAGFPDYEISDAGNVRRARPYYKTLKQGRVACFPKNTLLSPQLNVDGYRTVRLRNGKAKYLRVAILVCSAFHGPKPSQHHEVAHRDGSKDNDAATNLRWATPDENWADKRRHGRATEGENHPSAKLSAEQVREIRMLWDGGYMSRAELSRRFLMSWRQINGIVNRRSWRHL